MNEKRYEIKEGLLKKGGQNKAPTSSPPSPPKPQGINDMNKNDAFDKLGITFDTLKKRLAHDARVIEYLAISLADARKLNLNEVDKLIEEARKNTKN